MAKIVGETETDRQLYLNAALKKVFIVTYYDITNRVYNEATNTRTR